MELTVCRREQIRPGESRRVEPGCGIPAIAVYDVGGRLYATDDRCTHAKASLCDGLLEDDVVVCPVHAGRFHVATGRALGFPATRDLRVHEVVVRDGDVIVVVDARRPEPSAPGGRRPPEGGG